MPKEVQHRVEVHLDDSVFQGFERMRGTMSKQAYLVRAVQRSIKQDQHMYRSPPGEKRDRDER